MTHTSVISSQGQITMPVAIREQLGVETGSVLMWEVKVDDLGVSQVVVTVGTVKALKKLRGVAKKFYARHGGGSAVLAKERESWSK